MDSRRQALANLTKLFQQYAAKDPTGLWALSPAFHCWSFDYGEQGFNTYENVQRGDFRPALPTRRSRLQAIVGQSYQLVASRQLPTADTADLVISPLIENQIDRTLTGGDRYFGQLPVGPQVWRWLNYIGQSKSEVVQQLTEGCSDVTIQAKDLTRPWLVQKFLATEFRRSGLKTSDLAWLLSKQTIDGFGLFSQIVARLKSPEFASIQRAFVAYEGHAMHHWLVKAIKRVRPAIKVFGYVHTNLSNTGSHYMRRPWAPDYLIVHGRGYRSLLETSLGWNAEQIIESPTLRFTRPKDKLSGYVYLPYKLPSTDKVLAALQAFLEKDGTKINPLTPRVHPAFANDASHNAVKRSIEDLFEKYRDRFSPDGEDCSVYVGMTSALFEALENRVSAVHISTNPEIEAYSPELFPDLVQDQISENAWKYTLKSPGAFIAYPEQAWTFADLKKDLPVH